MPHPPMRALIVVFALMAPLSGFAQEVFINELHYDNVGGDTGEFVEIAGPAGTDLGGYSLRFYNGDGGGLYMTKALSGVIPSEAGSGFGALAFPVSGIQNGGPDGVALIDEGTLIQFLSYEGEFTAVGGAAAGVGSVDIGVAEPSTTPAGQSLQLVGSGSVYSDYAWSGPSAASRGEINAGQTFEGSGVPSLSLTLSPQQFFESAGGVAASGSITVNPAPAGTVVVELGVDLPGEVTVPSSVEVGPSGVGDFEVGAVADGVGDGTQVVELSATVAGGGYSPASISVTVFDSDPPRGRGVALRVAAYNLKNGAGSPGSAQYDATLSVLRRIGADCIAFSEVDAGADFGDLRALLLDLGMGIDPAHLATSGDAFDSVPFEAGIFGSGSQSLAFASRWPITEVVQIGRGVAGQSEAARFPLFVTVDVPGVAADPSFVTVHLKAGNFDVDNFRRVVEAWRIREFLEGRGIAGASDNVFVLGDFNEDIGDPAPVSYSTDIDPAFHIFGDGSTLPGSYALGADLAPPHGRVLEYAVFPTSAFSPLGISVVNSFQPDGGRRTFNVGGDARIDYILTGSATFGNAPPESEVYNSLLEVGFDGLPKVGQVPAGVASFEASDHHALFGDFVLESAPRILIGSSPADLGGAEPSSAVGFVNVSPAPVESVEVELFVEGDRLQVPASVIVPAGGDVMTFPISLLGAGGVVPEAQVRVTGHAAGHVSGHGYVSVTGDGPSGLLLFSQYVEALSGASPRAIEVVNNSGAIIDFAATPLRLLIGYNGALPVTVLTVASGLLEAGEVFVVGAEASGDYLVSEGALDPPPFGFGEYADGAIFVDADGRIDFVKQVLLINGDDSLQLQLAFVLADVIGQPGIDPGAAWEGQGVSTANQNIRLLDDVASPSAGFGDPSGRFMTVAEGGLSGFGVAPVRDDPYSIWATGFGLSGIASAPVTDLEPDGWNQLLEYALGGDPQEVDYGAALIAGTTEISEQLYLTLRHLRRVEPGRLSYQLEGSLDGRLWEPVSTVVHAPSQAEGEGIESVTLRLTAPVSEMSASLFRLRVRLP